MLNDTYDPPSENEELIIEALDDGGRLRPMHISERTGKSSSALNHYLRRLVAAGWVVEPESQVYELAYDPREMSLAERARLFRDYADTIDPSVGED